MNIRVKNKRNTPRIVLDSNVLISGIVFGGNPRIILSLIYEDIITPIVFEELFTELRRKILAKFPNFIEDLDKIEHLLKRDAIIIKLGTIDINICRDSDDNKFIEAAIIGRCSFIITGDKDLLILKNYNDIEIITPSEFLNKLS